MLLVPGGRDFYRGCWNGYFNRSWTSWSVDHGGIFLPGGRLFDHTLSIDDLEDAGILRGHIIVPRCGLFTGVELVIERLEHVRPVGRFPFHRQCVLEYDWACHR
jgi:hypothetical protein